MGLKKWKKYLTNPGFCGTMITERKKEVIQMKRFRIEHKFSGSLSVIIGRDFYDACRRCGKDPKFWKKIEEF